MNKLITLLATVAVIAITGPSLAVEVGAKSETKIVGEKDGGFERVTRAERRDADGTKAKAETKVDLEVERGGDVTRTITTKETIDPKGLFNSDTVKTRTVEKLRDGKLVVEQEKTVNGEKVIEHKSKH